MQCQQCGFTNKDTAKFCKQCGTPMSHSSAAGAAPAVTPSAPVESAALVASAAPVASATIAACPQCGTARVAGKRFCRECRFDYSVAAQTAQQTAAGGLHAPDATPVAAPAFEAVAEAAQPAQSALA